MRGKREETSINESSSNSNDQRIQSNPYINTNVNQQQQQAIYEKAPEEPPPPYIATVQSPSNSQPKFENVAQNSSLNNQNVQQTLILQNHIWERHPTDVVCPNCGITVHTRVETSSTIVTVLVAILLFLCCFCLVVIPFFMSSCKKTIHYCPNCNRILGKVREFQ